MSTARTTGRLLEAVLWVALLMWAGWIRFRGLGNESLWGDEIRLVSLARRPVLEVWSRTVFPPVHLLVLKAASVLGDSEWVVRLPSAIAGVLGVMTVMVLARRALGRSAGVAAGVLLALSPFHIAVSREAKYFPLVVLFAALALLSLHQARRRPAWLWVFAAASVANMYTHTYAALLIACHMPIALWVVVGHVREKPVLVLALLVVIAASAPLLLRAVETETVGAESAIGDTPFEPLSATYYHRLLATFGPGPKVWPAALLLLLGLPSLFRDRSLVLLILASVCGPILLVVVLRPPIYVDRYLAPVLPSLVVWLAAAVALITRPLKSLGTVVPILAAFLLAAAVVPASGGIGVAPERVGSSREDWKGVATHLRRRVAPGDVVVLAQERKGWKLLLQYYMGDPGGVDVVSAPELPRIARLADTIGTRWWVMRGAEKLAPRMREVLDSSFDIQTFRGLILVARSGPFTHEQLCRETAWVMQARLLLPMVHWVRPAHYAVIGHLHAAAGDTSQATAFYRRALTLDPSLATALTGIGEAGGT